MSDLIRREDLVKELNAQFAVGDITREIANDILNNIPSAEPIELTAKVEYIAEVYRGEIVDHYLSGMCGICGEYAYDHAKYCSYCGAKLDWSGNE